MKHFILLNLLLFPFLGICQQDFSKAVKQAEELYVNEKFNEAYIAFKSLEQSVSTTDSLYQYTLWYYIHSTIMLEKEHREKEEFEVALKYGHEALELLECGKAHFDTAQDKIYYTIKNIAVSYIGMGLYKKAKKWRKKLYKAKKNNELPKDMSEYYNFDFFKVGNKNVWGYEWFHELPKNDNDSSFTKIVYYVYNTHLDGPNRALLYRLQVVKFHGKKKFFPYILDKQLETATNEISGLLPRYRYKKNIDFIKLHNDIREAIETNIDLNELRIRINNRHLYIGTNKKH